MQQRSSINLWNQSLSKSQMLFTLLPLSQSNMPSINNNRCWWWWCWWRRQQHQQHQHQHQHHHYHHHRYRRYHRYQHQQQHQKQQQYNSSNSCKPSTSSNPQLILPIIYFALVNLALSSYISVSPDTNAFMLFSPQNDVNESTNFIYLQKGCSWTSNQAIVSTVSGHQQTIPLSSIQALSCMIMVKVVSTHISPERPYVDLIAIPNAGALSNLHESLCVSAQLNLATSSFFTSSCVISPYGISNQQCLIRILVPFTYFSFNGGNFKQVVTLVYSVSTHCTAPVSPYSSPLTKIYLLPPGKNLQSFPLEELDDMHLYIRSGSKSITGTKNSYLPLFIYFSNNNKTTSVASIQIRIWLDHHFALQSVTETNSQIWKVGILQKVSPDNHTVISCRRRRLSTNNKIEGYLLAMTLQMKENVNWKNHSLTIRWSWQYNVQQLEITNETLSSRKEMNISIVPDQPYALVALTRDTNLINTAVLSGRQAALSVRIFTVSEGSIIEEVTTRALCLSDEYAVLKASLFCGLLYVDGSEMQGLGDVKVNVSYEELFTQLKITVWYPKLPITVWVSDPVLNRIKDWQRAVWKWLPGSRRKKDAKQIRCGNRFQQAEIRVLARFQIRDEKTGEEIYLAEQPQILFDVTALSADQVHSTNPSVAVVKRIDSKLLLSALRAGFTQITVHSNMPQIDYGITDVMVTHDTVSVSHISTEVVADVKLDVTQLPDKTGQLVVTSKLISRLNHKYQHASMLFQVHYSDDQVVDLTDIPSDEFVLNVWSSDIQTVAIVHNANEKLEIIALRDLPRASIKVQLRSSENCVDEDKPPLAYNQALVDVQFDDTELAEYDEEDTTVSTTAIITSSKQGSGKWPIQEIVVLLVVLSVIMGIVRAVGPWGRKPLSEGYEKLVLPLITRLSTSSSCGKDENSQEWIWLSKAEVDSYSLNSRYSRRSTVTVPESSSSSTESNNGRRNMSYLGSEINIFISPNPTAEIRTNRINQQAKAWMTESRLKPKRNSVLESSSENNLSSSNYEDQRYTEDETIGSLDHRLPIRHGRPQKFWMDQGNNTIRATSSCYPKNLDGLRESVA